MKKLTVLFLLFFVSTIGYAQEYKTKLGGAKKVAFVMSKSDVWVEGHDGDEIIIEAKGYQAPPKRAEGLRPLYNGAQDNTGIGLAIKNEGGVITFIRASSRKSIDYKIKLPRKVDFVVEQVTWSGGDVHIDNMQGEVEVKGKNADLFLNNVSGPIVAHTTSGDIQVVYSTVTPDKPSAITATSGYVDVTLPKNAKVTVSLRSISGEIYTDFDVVMEKNMKESKEDSKSECKNCNQWSQHFNRGTITGAINGGGAELKLKAISSDIYLRKAK